MSKAPNTVDGYIEDLDGWQREVVVRLRELILAAAPDAAEAIKWNQPVYSSTGPVCYVKSFAKHVNLGFWRGADLDDPSDLLEGTGDQMRHVPFRALDSIDAAAVTRLVKQAFALNEEMGDPTAAMPKSAHGR